MNGKNAFCLAAVLLVAAAASAHAQVTIGPAGSSFVANGTMVLRASGAAPTCSVTASGIVLPDGSEVLINSLSVSGGLLCGNAKVKGLPWSIRPATLSTAFISGVTFDIPPFVRCGPTTVNASWNNATNTLTAVGQPLGGNCTLESFTLSPNPAFTFGVPH